MGAAVPYAIAAKFAHPHRPVIAMVGDGAIKTDPEVPPLPPHINLKQARNFVAMLVKGDAEAGSVIANTARQVLSRILPGRKE